MKISLAWLNSHLDRPIAADEAAHLLTHLGYPVEEMHVTANGQDQALEVEVTSNRPDLLCHVGVAREVAAGTGRQWRAPDCTLPAAGKLPDAKVKVERPDLCPLYTARVIRGVKIGPSPAWLAQRLAAIGLRSVNNVVDATNYVLFEMGQPLHAFDLAKLDGQAIVVRCARSGEHFTAINGSKLELKDSMLVIADAQKPVAVAGVMGGLDSEVGPATVDVLLEAALFSQLSVRQTSRMLKLASDSSYRFERGLDPAGVELASRRCVKLICELAGGSIAEGVIRVGLDTPAPRAIEMRIARCRAILGYDLDGAAMVQFLERLGLQPRHDATRQVIVCQAPTHRLDLKREIDLIEEVGRLAGYDRIVAHGVIEVQTRPIQPAHAAGARLRDILVAHGYLETVTYSFVPVKQGAPFVPAGFTAVLIDDERRKREPMLRPSLLPSLLACRKANQDVGNHAVRLFETSATWLRQNGKIVETRKLTLLADVDEAAGAEASLRDLRGTVCEAVELLTGQALLIEPGASDSLLYAAQARLDGMVVGTLGQIVPAVQRVFELQTPVAAAEFDLGPLLSAYPPSRSVQPLSRFPSIERDLSVIVAEQVSWRRIEEQVHQTHPALLEGCHYVTTYRGKPIPAGRKSVTLRLVFRDPQATLRHEQVDPQVAAVVEGLKNQLGGEIRVGS